MEDLKLCVELGKLLLQPGKEVEDDTCLDRILSEVAKLLLSTKNERTSSFTEELLITLSAITDELGIHDTISAHGYLIQLLSHVISNEPKCSSFETAVTKILCYPDAQIQKRLREEYYSLASAWLNAIKNITTIWEHVCDLSETAHVYQHIITMAYSQSLFVRRQAVECLAMILIKLNCMKSDVEDIYKKFSINSDSLSVSSLLDLGRTMLTFSYPNGINLLASQEFCVTLSQNKDKLSELCHQCDPVLCHFFESLYCAHGYKAYENICNKVITPSETLWCAITCISHHPTKSAGWKILMSLVNYSESSHERDVAMSLIICCLKTWEFSAVTATMSLEYIVKCCNVLISRKNNIPALGSIFCHILNAIGSSNRDMPLQFKDPLFHLVRTISSSLNGNSDSHEVTGRLFTENNNAMIALLGCLSKTCSLFTSDEKESVYQLVLALMAKSSTHHAVIISCHEVVILLLQHSHNRDFLVDCIHASKDHFVDRRWEVRDSALQFFSTLLSVLHDAARTNLLDACGEYTVYTECINLICDSNAFVRATALTLLGNIVSSKQICNNDTVLEIILKSMNDDDIFPRRKAATALTLFLKSNDEFLTSLHQVEINSSLITSNSVILKKTQSAIHKALLEDLDWEVKYNSLGILHLLIEHDLQHHTSLSSQLVSLLHKMEDDYDDAVKEKASAIAASLGVVSNQSLKRDESESELHSLLVEALTSLRNNANKDWPATFSHDENPVILDCY